MKLSGEEYLRVSQFMQVIRRPEEITLKGIATASARGASVPKVEFIPEAGEIERVVGIITRESDVREDVVATLRERIENGTYNVTGEQIGEMMLRRFLADRSA